MIRRAAQKAVAFYRQPLDLPAVVLVVAWVGLWLLWPARSVMPERVRMPTGMHIRCVDLGVGGKNSYLRPSAFLDSGLTGAAVPAEGFADMLRAPRRMRSRPLVDERWPSGDASPTQEASLAGEVRAAMRPYVPQWRSAPAFLRSGTQDAQLVVRCSESLRRAGLQMAQLFDPDLMNGRSWQVRLYVEGDRRGTVQHVFVEQGSGDSVTDASLVRAMYRATLPDGAAGVYGRVTISYDRQ